jgi:hypothetical protein
VRVIERGFERQRILHVSPSTISIPSALILDAVVFSTAEIETFLSRNERRQQV